MKNGKVLGKKHINIKNAFPYIWPKRFKDFFYYQRVVIYANDLSKDHAFELNSSMQIAEATLEDIERLYNDDLNQDIKSIDWEIWKENISKGLWRGFVCKDGESIVAQTFYSLVDIFFGGTKWVVLSIPPGWAYGFKLYTREDYRGKKMGQAITSFKIIRMKQEGLRGYFGVINSDNVISRRVREKMGGYKIGSIVFLKCRYFNKVFLSPWLIKKGFIFNNKTRVIF